MRSLASLVLVLAAAVSAAVAAEVEWLDGRWAMNPEICSDKEGVVVITIDGDKVAFDGSHCTIVKLTKISDELSSAWRAELACRRDDSEPWVQESIIGIGLDERMGPRELVEVGLEDGVVFVRRRCD